MLLPRTVDKTPQNKIVQATKIGAYGHINNRKYTLVLGFFDYHSIEIKYKAEFVDDYLLDEEIKYILENLAEYEDELTEELVKGWKTKSKKP